MMDKLIELASASTPNYVADCGGPLILGRFAHRRTTLPRQLAVSGRRKSERAVEHTEMKKNKTRSRRSLLN